MRKLFILVLFVAGLAVACKELMTPDFVRINQAEVNRCAESMFNSPYLICD